MNCEHCGASEGLELPLSVQVVVKRTGVFLRKHRKCPAPKWPLADEETARAMHRLLGPGNALRRRYVLLPDGNILDTDGLSDPALEHWKVVEALNRKNNARGAFAESAPENWARFKASVASAAGVRKRLEGLEPKFAPSGEIAKLAEGLKDPAHPVNRAVARLEAPALPRAKPCGSCPYRRDVPAGVWHPEEYAKLPAYDGETFAQPVAPFFCHAQDGTLCAGWLGCHGPSELLAVRLGVSTGRLDPSCLDASTDVPLFESGAAAAKHGSSGVKQPGPAARAAIVKLTRAQRIRARKPKR